MARRTVDLARTTALAAVSLVAATARAQEELPPLPPPASTAAPAPPSRGASPAARPPAASPATSGPTSVNRSFSAAHTLARSVPMALTLDGSWSLAIQVLTELVSRTWSPPYPWGTLGQYSARILYGTSWTLMLGLEGVFLLAASGGTLDGLAEASFRSEWILGFDLPSCPSMGAYGGCGVGVGSMSTVAIRPRRSKWWFEAGGGWLEQRVVNDENRTVAESTWVLTPLTAVREVRVASGPVELRARAGPGIFFGAHQAHVHPTLRGRRSGLRPPWHEMYPLDAGLGPGARAELDVRLFEHVSIGGELVVAPFVVGGPTTRREPEIAPLDFGREGASVWRRATAELGWVGARSFPLKTSFALSVMELSDRPITRFGYSSALLRFDIPLDVARAKAIENE